MVKLCDLLRNNDQTVPCTHAGGQHGHTIPQTVPSTQVDNMGIQYHKLWKFKKNAIKTQIAYVSIARRFKGRSIQRRVRTRRDKTQPNET